MAAMMQTPNEQLQLTRNFLEHISSESLVKIFRDEAYTVMQFWRVAMLFHAEVLPWARLIATDLKRYTHLSLTSLYTYENDYLLSPMIQSFLYSLC